MGNMIRWLTDGSCLNCQNEMDKREFFKSCYYLEIFTSDYPLLYDYSTTHTHTLGYYLEIFISDY